MQLGRDLYSCGPGGRQFVPSRKDQAHFSEIAFGSLMELACLLILSKDIGILSEDSEKSLRESIEELSAQLNALHRSQRARM